MDTTLQIRIDIKTKEKARKAFKAAGLDLSSGTRLILAHIAQKGSIPTELMSPTRKVWGIF